MNNLDAIRYRHKMQHSLFKNGMLAIFHGDEIAELIPSREDAKLPKDTQWITVKGHRVPIDPDGNALGGMFKGKNFSQAGKGQTSAGNSTQKNTPASQKAKTAPAAPKPFGGRNSADFSKDVQTAKSELAKTKPEDAWRVTAHSQKELDDWYPNASMHTTDGGSTVAVTDSGDIISVCKNPNDNMHGKDILAMAVKNGGKKLDSYEGNHGFYVKCGFEPVSWCEWDDNFKPDDWDESRDKRENIIFYKYTGKTSQYPTAKDFFAAVPASKDYDTAQAERDKQV